MSRATLQAPILKLPPVPVSGQKSPKLDEVEPLTELEKAFIRKCHAKHPACDIFGNPNVDGLAWILRHFPGEFKGKKVTEARALHLLKTGH